MPPADSPEVAVLDASVAVRWHHAHVFRVWVDAAWLGTDVPRALTFETVFTTATRQPHATLSLRALAALFGV
jgi:hypothetical protein